MSVHKSSMHWLDKESEFCVVILGKKIVVVLPAYNAGKTLEKTYKEIPFDIVDDVILVDDASKDNTSQLAKELGMFSNLVWFKITKSPTLNSLLT